MFKNYKAAVMTAIMLIGSLLIAVSATGDDGREHEGGSRLKRSLDVQPVADQPYRKECGGCHFAYQPGLLPAASWVKIMNTLDNHFGDNAELAPEDQKAITGYLVHNGAETSGYKAPKKILSSLGSGGTLRITQTPYFIHKHREVPAKMVTGNPLVKSFSHCARCHAGADKGSYNEHEVTIPGFGKIED